MDTTIFLTSLRRELAAFEACLDRDLTTTIEHCGDWTLYDLADHLGKGNLWSATAVTEKRSDYGSTPAPREPAELKSWFHHTGEVLLAALQADPATEAWTFAPPRTVGFWHRRRCMETLIHRWDAEHALGEATPFDPRLAADGVTEVIDTMFPRQVRIDRTTLPERGLRLVTTDTDQTWTLGPDSDPAATAHGTAQTLFLLLWSRVSPEDPAIEWSGDLTAGLQALDRPLVP